MYKTILVYLPSTHAAEAATVTAAKLAQKRGARLIGAHNSVKLTIYGGVPEHILAQHNAREKQEADAVQFIFEEAARQHGVPHEWRHKHCKDTELSETVLSLSRTTDLLVAPGKDFDDPLGHWFDMPERLVMESGRPVLLVPRAQQPVGIGRNIMVGWNGKREAARAAFDALPLLVAADRVCVLTITEGRDATPQATSAGELVATLSRHGVQAELVTMGGTAKPDGEELATYVQDQGCDMLVMGFYGHSRLREMVWGGVTRYMLRHMTVPVFTSH
jgi:nucleotide-binding universal stress UspA family protein